MKTLILGLFLLLTLSVVATTPAVFADEDEWDDDDDTGNSMIEGDDGKIMFFEEGTYVLRVNTWAKQESSVEFQVIISSKYE